MNLNILYEDNQVIVVFKPRGLLSQADNTGSPDILSILKDYIKEKYNKPGAVYLGLVHRLDRNTSGVMVFARTSKAAARLSDLINKHEGFEKSYLAVVEGCVNPGKRRLCDMLYWDEKIKKASIKKSSDSKEAILEYNVISSHDNMTLLDVSLFTGRHHQIRCQLANMGHPIVGDLKYGSKIKMDNYYALSAYKLAFMHPTLKERMEFEYIDSNDRVIKEFYKDIKKQND